MKNSRSIFVIIFIAFAVLGVTLSSRRTSYISNNALASTTAKVSITPHNATAAVGDTVDISIMINVNGPYNAASMKLFFNKEYIQYLGRTLSAPFNGDGNKAILTSSPLGTFLDVYDNRTSGGSLTGINKLMTLRFRAVKPGVSYLILGTDFVVNFPTVNYSVSTQNSSLTVKPRPATPPSPKPNPPAPKPTPTPPKPSPKPNPPAPKPTPTPPKPKQTKTISRVQRPPTSSVPKQSKESEKGMQITDLAVTDIGYRYAVIEWKTSKESVSKVNVGVEADDLYEEFTNQGMTKKHKIKVEGDAIQAGKRYYFRVFATKGDETVHVDGKLSTKSIPVIIQATDNTDTPLPDSTISIEEEELTTDDKGEVYIELPEGEHFITAYNGDLYRELYATVLVPNEEDETQRITMNLSDQVVMPKKDSSEPDMASTSKKSSAVIIILLCIAALGGGGLFIWKKRSSNAAKYHRDPLDINNYPAQPIPSTPAPVMPTIDTPQTQSPGTSPPPSLSTPTIQYVDLPERDSSATKYVSLPTMLGRYGKIPTATHPNTSPLNIYHKPVEAEASNVSPTGQAIPTHSSLKDLVMSKSISNQPKSEAVIDVSDLPVAPKQSSVNDARNIDNDNGNLNIPR